MERTGRAVITINEHNVLGYKFTEPVPVRLNDPYGILHTAEHPYAALLWLEFLASPEGQKLLDEAGPYEGSLFVRGTVQEEAARGKKKSVIDWNHYTRVQEYERKIVEATSQYKEPVCTFSFRLPEPVRNATPKGGNVPASERPKADTNQR